MGKLVVYALLFVIGILFWQLRKHRARKRLQEIDEGKRCVSCDGTELQRSFNKARCLRCGYEVNLSTLRSTVLSEDDIEHMTAPDRDRH